MEGDGEGIVAIVEGLDTSGVTLTVCNRSRHNSDRRRPSRPRIQINAGIASPNQTTANQRSNTLPASSVDTSTGTDFTKQTTSSQICDGRYASSYKMAHCMVNPTSPQEVVSEFPPQRKEPCRNQGNFEVGGHGSAHSSGKVRVSSSRVKHHGVSQTWGEKGSSHRYCKSNRDTDSFAHSLRKYPSMAPFRTVSTDLIEKLIRYTQAKNFQEMSRSSKSMRSLRQQRSPDAYEMAKASKHQQTYTRRQDVNLVNSNVQVGYRGRTRNFKLYSPVSDSRNLRGNRLRETTLSSSYDYLKAGGSPYGRSNCSDYSPSPVESSSPERIRSPERFRSTDGFKSPEVSRSPVRFKSTEGFRSANRTTRSIRFEHSVRDLSLSDMSKYIRNTIRQICSERPVVFQVCPKLKSRYNQHKKVCPNKNDRATDAMLGVEPEEEQASGSVLSRIIQSFSEYLPSTEQAACQCTRTDCYCSTATQCVNNPDTSTNTPAACNCTTPTKTSCCRGMPCICANKSQDQAYYNKRIDEEISEWLKYVPVHSVEGLDSKKKRETAIKELRKTLKQLSDDEHFDENARHEIKSLVDDFPLWNPGRDRKDEKVFKKQLADKLTERILSVPRKPDRFRDIVKKWVVNMDFEDDGEDIDEEIIIDKFVNKLKSVAVDRPACDIKYRDILRKEILELLVDSALKFDGDMVMLKRIANKLATEIVSIPRNVNLSGDTSDLTDEFEENVTDWICERGLCGELKKDPKLIEGLAKKLNKLKSQGIDDECVVEKMKDEIHLFVDDVGIAIETMDELIDELVKQLSNTVQTNEMERLDKEELTEICIDWLNILPGASDLHPRKLEKIIKELVTVIMEGRDQENENLINDILNYLVEADLSIDPPDLSIYVEELLEKLNLLPSNKRNKEQVKKALLNDIFDIIEDMSISEGKKEDLRNEVQQIVENHLRGSSLNSTEDHDDVKEAIMEDIDDAISVIDIPKESRLKLQASLRNKLNSNFDKSLTRLKRPSRDGSNLKHTIAKDVRKAVKELSIDTNKKRDLMQQVKGTLTKNMHKPLPNNVKNTIKDEISDVVERCPISEDNSTVGCLKTMLSAVASKHLNICFPKCVCDIQNKVEKHVGNVIDRSSIDTGKKKELKKSIKDIFAQNEDRHISDEVLETIKKDINGVVSDLSIPQDKKDILKKTVGETISKDFNEALLNLRHDLNKIRDKLFEDICSIIKKSPIPRDVEKHLINKLQSVLARNLDSSLSDEEKYTILDDVLNIVKDDMPEEKRRSLTNKLAKKLDTKQRKEDTNVKRDEKRMSEIEKIKNLKELENKTMEYIVRDMEQAIEEAPITRKKKIELKNKLKDMTTIDYKKPADDNTEALTNGINEILDELNLTKDKINHLKSELTNPIDEHSKLLREIEDVGTEYQQIKRKSKADTTDQHSIYGEGLMKIENIYQNKAKECILQGTEKIIEESAIPEDKKQELRRKLEKMTNNNLKMPLSDGMQDSIETEIADIIDDMRIRKSEKDKLKRALIKKTNENIANLRDFDKTKEIESISQGIEKIIEESAIPEEKKKELRRRLEKMATDNLKMPLSDDIQDAMETEIADILDDMQIPKSEKDKLKRALIKKTNENIDNLRNIDKTKRIESISQGIENIIEESSIPEEKQKELKRKLEKMAIDNLKMPLSDDVQEAMETEIADILDDMKIPKSEKDKLKRALIKKTNENIANLRDVNKTKGIESISQGIEKIIEESAIPEEKKKELRRRLEKMATDNLKMPLSDDVQDAMETEIADILDDMQIPKSEKDKLKRALIKKTNENIANLRDVGKTKGIESISQGIEKIIEESAIPEEKKKELRRKLEKMANDNSKMPLSDNVEDTIQIEITDILDDMQIPKSERDKLKRALINKTNENIDSLRNIDKTKRIESISQGIENIIEESSIPEEKQKELKRKLEKMAIDNLKMPLLDDVQEAMETEIADILDDMQIPKSERDKLKRALINKTNENIDNLRNIDKTKRIESISQGIENIIEKSSIHEEKQKELKRKLEKMAIDNLKMPLSDDVQEAMETEIADILDDMQIPKSEKDKLKRALIKKTNENIANLRDIDKTKGIESISQGNEKIIEESAIPEEKKKELKRKLDKMATDNLKMPLSDDVQDAMETEIADILDDMQIPKSEKEKLKRALIKKTNETIANLRDVDKRKGKQSISQGIGKIIEQSAISEKKKRELKKKMKKMATDNLKMPLSDDVEETIQIEIADILDDLQISKPEKDKLKRALTDKTGEHIANLREIEELKRRESISQRKSNIVDDSENTFRETKTDKLKGLMPIEEVEETDVKEGFLKRIENIIEESSIPEEEKENLKRKLYEIAVNNLNKARTNVVQETITIGIADVLDELQLPKIEKKKLKRALVNLVDENEDGLPDFDELDNDTKKKILLEFVKAIDESSIPLDKKKELKNKLKVMVTKYFQELISDDTLDSFEDSTDEILDELNRAKDKKNKLKSELTAAVDEDLNLINESNLVKSMPYTKRNELNDIIRRVLPQFDDAVDPSYQKQLSEEFDELLEIALTGGDFKNARGNLINKLMNEQNLSEKEASEFVDELIGKSREMALKEDMGDERYELDPSYVKTLEPMRELKLPEDQASVSADDLTSKAQTLPPAAQSKDKPVLHKKAFAKAISNAVDQSTLSKPEKSSLKNMLLSKVKQIMDKKPFINYDDLEPLKSEVLKHSKQIVDTSSIPSDKKNELNLLLNKALAKAIDEIMKAENAVEKLKKYKKAFAAAISNAVDQSTLSKPDKSSSRNKLLGKLNQTLDNSPYLYDIGALIADVLKDSEKVVDVSSIPTEKKSELKLLLQEAIEEAFKELIADEEDLREAPEMSEGKISQIVKTWLDSLPIHLDAKLSTAVAKDIASDILDRQKYLQVHPEALSTDKDEIENLKYQIFRRMKTLVDPKDLPPIMERTGELYRMITDILPPLDFPKLRGSSLRGLINHN